MENAKREQNNKSLIINQLQKPTSHTLWKTNHEGMEKSNYPSLAYNFYKLLFVEDPDYYQQVTCQAEDRCYDYSACREDVGIEGLF